MARAATVRPSGRGSLTNDLTESWSIRATPPCKETPTMQYVAFLRGMNLGGRRITNDDLCDCFRHLDLQNVWAFLASGNVAFESSSTSRAKVSQLIETGLREALGYEVRTFLRAAKDVVTLAEATPFAAPHGAAGGKLQVSLLAKKPTAAQAKKALSFATEKDQLAIRGQELYWLPEGNLTDSDLNLSGIEKALGPMTIRTQRTIQRLSKRISDQLAS